MDPIRLRAARATSKLLSVMVTPVVRRRSPLAGAPGFATAVFVIGPPRSGTTLVYQLLQRAVGARAWTNRDAHLYAAPYLALARSPAGPTARSFTSQHGRTADPSDVHEGAQLWYRWFDGGRSPWGQTLDPAAACAMRTELRWCARAAGQTVAWKNTYNSARVEALAAALPEAVFVVVERDVFATAASILTARDRAGARAWWSLPVPGYEALQSQSRERQAVAQVVRTYHGIDTAMAVLGREPVRVCYESLCDDPAGTLSGLRATLLARGVRLAPPSPMAAERFSYRSTAPSVALVAAARAERAWRSTTTARWFDGLEPGA